MTERHRDQHCAFADERLEAYADGELPAGESAKVARHLEACPACRAELELAGRIRAELGSLSAPACPAPLAEELTGIPAPRRGWMPAAGLGALAASLLAVAVLWTGGERATEPSPRELAQARQDLELALGYIGKAGRMAGRDVGAVVTKSGLMAPIRDGMQLKLNIPVPKAARTDEMES